MTYNENKDETTKTRKDKERKVGNNNSQKQGRRTLKPIHQKKRLGEKGREKWQQTPKSDSNPRQAKLA